jgi:hypothetical protein
MIVLAALFAALQTDYAEAAAIPATSGFWAGLGDGFFSLMKLVASLFADLTLFDREARTWSYDLGFGLGVLGFVALAGAADYALESDPQGWGRVDPQTSHHSGLPSPMSASSPVKMGEAGEGPGIASGLALMSLREDAAPGQQKSRRIIVANPTPASSWHSGLKADEDHRRSDSRNTMQSSGVPADPHYKTPRHE